MYVCIFVRMYVLFVTFLTEWRNNQQFDRYCNKAKKNGPKTMQLKLSTIHAAI